MVNGCIEAEVSFVVETALAPAIIDSLGAAAIMRNRATLVSFIAGACIGTSMLWPQSAWAAKRVALAIGIDAYDNLKSDHQLRKAVNDSRSVGSALSAVGFEVIRGENLQRLDFNRTWQRFLNRIEPGDTVAVFFAGHGVEIAGTNFLLARDVPQVTSGEDELLKGEAIGLPRLLDDLRARQPKLSVLILDACRNNPFAQPGGRSVGASRGLTRVEAPEGTFVMFSAGTGEAALDRLSDADGDTNSVYTRRLIPLLTRPGLSLPDLAQEVRRQVRELAASVRHRQTPAYYDEVLGRFCLASCDSSIAPAQVAIGDPIAPVQPVAPPSRIAAPNEALPAELPIRPEILRIVETDPFFANAPPVRAGSYNIVTTITATTNGLGTMTSNFNDITALRWLRQGLVRQDLTQKYTVNNAGSVGRYSVRSSNVSVANGFFSLSYRTTSTVAQTQSTTTSQTTRLENLKGRLFPVILGNRFSYESEYQWGTSAGHSGGAATKHSCEVTKRYDARSFHSDLTGDAYLLTCDNQSIEKNGGSLVNAQSREVFFDVLGIWLKVDPASPREQIVSNNETSVNGQYTTVSNGNYTLKSFALAR
jgi:hypothetical protein